MGTGFNIYNTGLISPSSSEEFSVVDPSSSEEFSVVDSSCSRKFSVVDGIEYVSTFES